MREGGRGGLPPVTCSGRTARPASRVEALLGRGLAAHGAACEEPWYKKPLTPARLRLFLKRYGGSLADDAGRRGHAAFVFSDVMHLHGIPLGGGADGLGALYVRRAESVAMTVAFLATGCTLADMAAITGFCEEAIVQRVTRTWDGDTSGRIYGLTHTAYHDRIPETFASSDDLTSLGMIGYAHVEDDEGTSSPRTPQRHRPPRRFTAAPMTRRLTRWIMGRMAFTV